MTQQDFQALQDKSASSHHSKNYGNLASKSFDNREATALATIPSQKSNKPKDDLKEDSKQTIETYQENDEHLEPKIETKIKTHRRKKTEQHTEFSSYDATRVMHSNRKQHVPYQRFWK